MSENDYIPLEAPKPMERNQVTWAKHRRDVRLQVFLPLGIGVLIAVLMGILVVLAGTAQVSQGADVALIWLIAPMLVVTLVFLAILIAIAYGLAKLLQVLPFYTRQVQDFFLLARDQIAAVSNKMVEPFLRAESKQASWKTLLRNLRRK